MNYTKSIREYCLNNQGTAFDMSYEHEHHFSEVPYRTFCKILNRLEEEGILKTYSKGIYLISSNGADIDPVLSFYANDNTGVVIGYEMYNELGITNHNEKPIEVLTNAMETTTKNIGENYRLILFKGYFDKFTKKLIKALEIIENNRKIIELNMFKMNKVLIMQLQYYKDEALENILKNRNYSLTTIKTLQDYLDNLEIENKVSEIAKEYFKNTI